MSADHDIRGPRVVHLAPQFPYFGGRTVVGGYAVNILTVSSMQRRRRWDVSIGARIAVSTPAETLDGVPIISLGDVHGSGSMTSTLAFLARATCLAFRLRDVDVLHIHSGHTDYMFLTALVGRVARRPKIVHTIYCPPAESGFRRKRQQVAIALRPRRCRVAAMSENVSKQLISLNGRLGDVSIIRPAVDVDYWAQPPLDRHRYRRRHDEMVVLFVGNASPEKNLAAVIRALGDLKRCGVPARLIATTELDRTTSTAGFRDLSALARAHGVEQDIVGLTIVQDMQQLMASCDVHVAPFRSTQGPSDYYLATLEAMAAGRVVIASALEGMREVIVDGENGLLVDPTDHNSLVRALRSVQDVDVRRQLGMAAQHRVRELFEPTTVESSLQALYAI